MNYLQSYRLYESLQVDFNNIKMDLKDICLELEDINIKVDIRGVDYHKNYKRFDAILVELRHNDFFNLDDILDVILRVKDYDDIHKLNTVFIDRDENEFEIDSLIEEYRGEEINYLEICIYMSDNVKRGRN